MDKITERARRRLGPRPARVRLAAGTLAWYGGFALAVAAARHRVGPLLLSTVDVGIGAGLVAFGGLPGYRALRENE